MAGGGDGKRGHLCPKLGALLPVGPDPMPVIRASFLERLLPTQAAIRGTNSRPGALLAVIKGDFKPPQRPKAHSLGRAIVLETGPLPVLFYRALTTEGLPAICDVALPVSVHGTFVVA